MAHFAELDQNNVVLRVIVVANKDTADENGNEVEAIGVAFCQSLFGSETIWKQTSYHANFRKNYASIGYLYDPVRDAFIAPQPDPSCVFDEDKCSWNCPPNLNAGYVWDEDLQIWVMP
jgi:hypothetical protein